MDPLSINVTPGRRFLVQKKGSFTTLATHVGHLLENPDTLTFRST